MIEPNNDEVICPKCCHQFRAIPVNVQADLATLRTALKAHGEEAAKLVEQRDELLAHMKAFVSRFDGIQDSPLLPTLADFRAAIAKAEA